MEKRCCRITNANIQIGRIANPTEHVHLTERLGKGWSEENLRLMRKFYTLYSHWQSPINKIQTNGLEIQSPKIQTTGSEIQSAKLEPEYGSGFSYRQLKFCRQFYRTYPIGNTLRSQLNWSQYRNSYRLTTPTNGNITNYSR